jgi:hypothetical protein
MVRTAETEGESERDTQEISTCLQGLTGRFDGSDGGGRRRLDLGDLLVYLGLGGAGPFLLATERGSDRERRERQEGGDGRVFHVE